MDTFFPQSTAQVALACAALSLVSAAIWVTYARTTHPLAKYPGPFWASVSRFWISWRFWKGDMDIALRRLHREHGPIVRIAHDEVSIADPGAIKTIYGVNSGFAKTDFYPVWRPDFARYPDHFTQTDERQHAERRRIVNSIYSMSNILRSEACIDACIEVFMAKMDRLARRGAAADLRTWIQWFAFDVIGELYFSRMFGFLEREEDHERWIGALETLLPTFGAAAVLPAYLRPFLFLGSLAIPGAASAIAAMGTISTASAACVKERLAAIESQQPVKNDILQRLMETVELKGDQTDFKMIDVQTEVYAALFAGSDNSMIAICAVIYHLLKNPDAYATLMAELHAATKDGRLSRSVRYREAAQLPYLDACIKEGMRLQPSLGFTLSRYVPRGGRIICGEYFPQGFKVGILGIVVHRDEHYFGADPESFRPERWLAEGAAAMDRYFFTFSSGSRMCIGKNIALCEIYKLIPQLLRDYELELAHGPEWEWTTVNHSFIKPVEFPVNIRRRQT